MSISREAYEELVDISKKLVANAANEINVYEAGYAKGRAEGGSPYDGDYEIIPKVDEQKLATAKKTMKEDLTIKAIPFFEVSNNTGGTTVTIGSEV